MPLIGTKNTFGFEIKPHSDKRFDKDNYCYITIWINNCQLINPDEIIYLPTFKAAVSRLISKLKDRSISFENTRFTDKKDNEIFQLLIDSKTFVDNNPEWKLNTENPIIGGLDDRVYFKHLITIDESIDQYLIFMIESKNKIRFIWKCQDPINCEESELDKINSGDIDKIELIETLDRFIKNNAP